MNNISMDKKYRYRNGEPARILCIDAKGIAYPVVSITQHGTTITHCITGEYKVDYRESDWDLIEVMPEPEKLLLSADEIALVFGASHNMNDALAALGFTIPKQKVKVDFWVNVYDGCVGDPCDTKEEADDASDPHRLACIHIEREVEEGEGL